MKRAEREEKKESIFMFLKEENKQPRTFCPPSVKTIKKIKGCVLLSSSHSIIIDVTQF